jgi:hypothetical protein
MTSLRWTPSSSPSSGAPGVRPPAPSPGRATPAAASTAARVARWAMWPAGLGLVLLRAPAALVPLWAAAVLAGAYLALVGWLLVRAPGQRSPGTGTGTGTGVAAGAPRLAAALAAASGPLIFALAGLTGAPTAERPGAMIGNAMALLVAAGCLLAAGVALTCHLWDGPGRAWAAGGLTVLGVGSTLYLLNLVGRLAVVLAGWSGQQAAVEDQAWQASSYLVGLPANDRPVVVLLVCLDLLQLAYVVCTFAACACLAAAAGRAGLLAERTARVVRWAGVGAGMTVVVGIVVAGAVVTGRPTSGTVHDIGAAVAFALTIPFVTTLLPHVLGLGLLEAGRAAPSGSS